MNREEIIEASRCSACEMNCIDCRSNTTNRAEAVDGYCSSKSVKCPFELGAEWMQEQKQAEIRHLEALVETQKAIIGYNENKLSVLTEQLDAAHVFCEGVKEHCIKKACKWLDGEIDETYNIIGYVNDTKEEVIERFEKAMKGE